MSRIYFSVYGIGSGHSIRCYRLARELYKNGYELYLSTFGDGRRIYSNPDKSFIFKKIFYTSDYEYGWTTEGLSWRATIARSLISVNVLKNHLRDELVFLKSVEPDIIISDSRISSIIAAYMLNIPSVLITNQLSIRSTVNLFNNVIGLSLPRIWKLAYKIIIQDLPPPYTITWSNIYPYLSMYNPGKIEFIGLMENLNEVHSLLPSDKRDIDVLFLVSAPTRDRINFFKTLYHHLVSVKNKLNYDLVIIEGNPNKNRKISNDNLRLISWVNNPLEYIRRSKIVVLRGGQTSILEAILMGTPMIIMPAINQTEQIENARRVQELGIGRYLNYSIFLKNGVSLWKMIENIFEDYDIYLRNIFRLRKILIDSGGIDKVISLIGELM